MHAIWSRLWLQELLWIDQYMKSAVAETLGIAWETSGRFHSYAKLFWTCLAYFQYLSNICSASFAKATQWVPWGWCYWGRRHRLCAEMKCSPSAFWQAFLGPSARVAFLFLLVGSRGKVPIKESQTKRITKVGKIHCVNQVRVMGDLQVGIQQSFEFFERNKFCLRICFECHKPFAFVHLGYTYAAVGISFAEGFKRGLLLLLLLLVICSFYLFR